MNSVARRLLAKIQSKKANLAVVGLGYVGLPLALSFVRKGFLVLGIDVDSGRVEKIRRGESYVEDIESKDLAAALRGKKFGVSARYDESGPVDVFIVCVPTPLNRVKDPDLSYIIQATDEIRSQLKPGQLIILESTTYPGTTEEVILPTLERSGLRVGKDFFLCFSPERIDPGNKKFPLEKIPKVVGGMTSTCTELGCALYRCVIEKVIAVSSARTAEMTKLLENTFRIVNIGLVNELAQVAEALRVDIWEAIEAASTKPFGFMPFYPGPGIGGHCIGIDPVYLSWKARLHGADVRFIELARAINARMPRFVVERVVHTLNQHAKKAVSQAKILVLGVSYKRDVADTRESPAFEILEELERLGAQVSYHDPYVSEIKNERLRLESKPLTPKVLRSQDLVIIASNHSSIDYSLVTKHAPLIFDTRNVSHPAFRSSKVVRL